MSDIAIRVENLSKLYHIGAKQDRPDNLREWLTGSIRRNKHDARDEALWALKDVSFEVKRGEVVGVVGRNGAGKSTLLKILSRITEPTGGRVEMDGRVGSLLEVGTGFHPELSGRENIYLSGAILGMHRAEIDRRFDEIVDFSGVEKFIDTPIKRYSSGMQVRLGFAVAAHLEPEILLVDEVLAVGDADFQKKCLRLMSDVALGGRTVVFVSHNLGAVSHMCPNSLWIDKGSLVLEGETERVIQDYLQVGSKKRSAVIWGQDASHWNSKLSLTSIRITDSESRARVNFRSDEPIKIEIKYAVHSEISELRMGFRLSTSDGVVVLSSTSLDAKMDSLLSQKPGKYTSICTIPARFLNAGNYLLTIACDIPMKEVLILTEPIISFEVDLAGGVGTRYADNRLGFVRPLLDWNTSIDG